MTELENAYARSKEDLDLALAMLTQAEKDVKTAQSDLAAAEEFQRKARAAYAPLWAECELARVRVEAAVRRDEEPAETATTAKGTPDE